MSEQTGCSGYGDLHWVSSAGTTSWNKIEARPVALRISHFMADPLYLSIWFPNFSPLEMMHRAASVLRVFPFSNTRPGIEYLSVQPVNWSEPTILERRFRPGLDPDQAVAIAGDILHDDHAYVFEVMWDLWIRGEDSEEWSRQPSPVKVIVNGVNFDDGS